MSSPPPTAPETPRGANPGLSRLGLSRRALLLIALAFGVGLLLFLLLWLDQRNDDDFFRAGSRPAGERGQEFEPLPTPDAAGGSIRQPETRERDDDGVAGPAESDGVIQEPVEEPPSLASDLPETAAPAPAAAATSARPVRSPPPRYPPRALQRGESGTVLLQVQVDERGHPQRVEVVQSSRSRSLDREAVRAVERWEFAPATRNGQAVATQVLVPIEFNP